MLHYIFVNDTGNISDNLTVFRKAFFGIFHKDSYAVSASVRQKNKADVITAYLLSFGIKVACPRFMSYYHSFIR